MPETKKVVEIAPKDETPTISKREALRVLFRGAKIPAIMLGSALAGALVTARSMSDDSSNDDDTIDVFEVDNT